MHWTYVWLTGTGDCQLKYIRTISPNRTQETWLVDHHHKLLLNQTGISSMPGCRLALTATQLRNLYLVDLSLPERRQAVQSLPQVTPSEKNEQQGTGAALAYASYQLHQQITAASQTARTRICQQQ